MKSGFKLTPFPEKTTFKKPSLNKVKNDVLSQILSSLQSHLKALRQPSRKCWPKILTPNFFYCNLYLHFLRPCCENIFKIVFIVLEKSYSHNLTHCFLLQPIAVYSSSEIESTFSVTFWEYVTDSWYPIGLVSICLIRKGKHD